MTEQSNFTTEQQADLIAVADALVSDVFTPKPGWNWPAVSANRLALTMESPDDEGDLEVHIVIRRVLSDEDFDD